MCPRVRLTPPGTAITTAAAKPCEHTAFTAQESQRSQQIHCALQFACRCRLPSLHVLARQEQKSNCASFRCWGVSAARPPCAHLPLTRAHCGTLAGTPPTTGTSTASPATRHPSPAWSAGAPGTTTNTACHTCAHSSPPAAAAAAAAAHSGGATPASPTPASAYLQRNIVDNGSSSGAGVGHDSDSDDNVDAPQAPDLFTPAPKSGSDSPLRRSGFGASSSGTTRIVQLQR